MSNTIPEVWRKCQTDWRAGLMHNELYHHCWSRPSRAIHQAVVTQCSAGEGCVCVCVCVEEEEQRGFSVVGCIVLPEGASL